MDIYTKNLIYDLLRIVIFAGVILLWLLPYIREYKLNKKQRNNERKNKRPNRRI